MSAGWVAGTVRARAMARRVLGTRVARELAASSSLAEAQRGLRSTPFRAAAEPGLSLDEAQHAIAATVLWDLRVLAGWLPRDGVSMLRLLAGWFEIANVDELLQALAGRRPGPAFQLGGLATAWPRLSQAGSVADLRRALSTSAWGDPGGDTATDIRAALRTRWADRLAASGPRTRAWAAAAAGLGPASSRRTQPPAAGRRGRPARAAADRSGPPRPPAITRAVPWQAEADWWRQVERDGRALLQSAQTGSEPVLGAVIVIAADARRVRAALGSAARGGQALEVYDAVG